MTNKEYIKNVLRSESASFNNINERILHGVIGCVTEAGELADNLKKATFYGRGIDHQNIKEELGDLLWYVALILSEEGWTFEEIMEANIRKLKARYPEQFTEGGAFDRDIKSEMEALDNGKT